MGGTEHRRDFTHLHARSAEPRGMWLLEAFAELIAPSTCAACDVATRALFCSVCSISVVAAPDGLVFGGAVADVVRRFKFGGRPDLAPRLAHAMLQRVSTDIAADADIVVPVPLHPGRLAERGYNQSALLARPIAKGLGRPFSPRALARVRDTSAQSDLDRAGRRENLAGAFIARNFRSIEGRNVLLVDDVRTTGFTLRACTSVLHEVGARRVIPLVFACRELDRRDGSAV